MEDAETLRMMTREILEGAGYAVIESSMPVVGSAEKANDTFVEQIVPQVRPLGSRQQRSMHPCRIRPSGR